MKGPATLRELDRRDGEPTQLASAILARAGTWLDAVAIYLDHRRRDCEREMGHCSTLNVPDWAARIKALAEITTKLGEVEDFRAEVRRGASCPTDETERLSALGALMAPPGWREFYGEKLLAIRDAATASLVQLDNVAVSQCVFQEIDRLVTFLGSVEHQGESARRRLGHAEPARAGVTALRDHAVRAERPESIRKMRRKAANGG